MAIKNCWKRSKRLNEVEGTTLLSRMFAKRRKWGVILAKNETLWNYFVADCY
jgi:hypothetical protein